MNGGPATIAPEQSAVVERMHTDNDRLACLRYRYRASVITLQGHERSGCLLHLKTVLLLTLQGPPMSPEVQI